jgi:hypothetical protein
MSRRIASELGHDQYFAASGSLSDYEALDSPPRHIHKAITLCAVYGLQFSTFLKSVGLNLEETGNDPIRTTRFLPTDCSRQQQNPLACSIRNECFEGLPFPLGSIVFVSSASALTMLPETRSGNAYASSSPIFAYTKLFLFACKSDPDA